MPILIFMMLLFIGLGLIWVIAAGVMVGTLVAGIPNVLDKVLDYKGENRADHFPFKPQA